MYIDMVADAISKLPMPTTGMVRISVGHSVTGVMRVGDPAAEVSSIGILASGPWNKNRVLRFQALGGAMALTEMGQRYLAKDCGAQQFHCDEAERVTDARCLVPVDSAQYALQVLADTRNAPKLFERSPRRELIDELTIPELADLPPVCTEGALDGLQLFYCGVAVQPPPDDGVGTSVNVERVPTRRMFHCWNVALPATVFDAVMEAEQLHCFSEAELASTNGGRQKGRLDDGTAEIADNIGLTVIAP